MENGNTTDREPVVPIILWLFIPSFGGVLLVFLMSILLVKSRVLDSIFDHPWAVAAILVLLLLFSGPVALYAYNRLAPFLDVYTKGELQPFLNVQVLQLDTTSKDKDLHKDTLDNIIGQQQQESILYFLPLEDLSKVDYDTLREQMRNNKREGIKPYSVLIPPSAPSKESDAAEVAYKEQALDLQKELQESKVIVDSEHGAFDALREVNNQIEEPNVALLYAPAQAAADEPIAKLYPGVGSRMPANEIRKDANILSEEKKDPMVIEPNNQGDTSSKAEDQPPPPPSTSSAAQPVGEGKEKTPPYNFYFAIASVGVAAVAYILTILIFQGLIEAPGDVAIVSGALGVLFTLIGTIAGTFFGIKSSSDTQDKARAAESKANERTHEANKRALDESDKARIAYGLLDPNDPRVAQKLDREG